MNLATRLWKSSSRRSARTIAFNRAIDMALQELEGRRMCSVSAIFSGGVLNVFGDNSANSITISRDATGKLLVNNGTVPIKGAPAIAANARLIEVFGGGGDDTILLDETNGVLPKANIFGGGGNDTLTGGSGNDQIMRSLPDWPCAWSSPAPPMSTSLPSPPWRLSFAVEPVMVSLFVPPITTSMSLRTLSFSFSSPSSAPLSRMIVSAPVRSW
jgi:hypothetical protein